MFQLSAAQQIISVGVLDDETYEMINLIDSYPFPADFYTWLSRGNMTHQVIQDEISNGKYKRIDQYYIENTLIFTGKSEINLGQISKDGIQNLTREKKLISQSTEGLEKLSRKPMTKISTELHYTIVAHFYNRELAAGFSWEIFELTRIIEMYNEMNDPLRYWRKE